MELLPYSETLVTISLYNVTCTKTFISIIAAVINSYLAIIIAFTFHFLPDNFSRLLDRYTVAMFLSSLILHRYFYPAVISDEAERISLSAARLSGERMA